VRTVLAGGLLDMAFTPESSLMMHASYAVVSSSEGVLRISPTKD
jgi:hypothetical protein